MNPVITTPSTAAGAILTATVLAANPPPVADLLAAVQSTDDKVRGPAWQNAGPAGAPAIAPLAGLMSHQDFEVARCAKRAIERIVRHAGRPGAAPERQAVAAELVKLLGPGQVTVRQHALWMLSEIGDDTAVPAMATLLAELALAEDARCALERIPGTAAVKALRSAFDTAPEAFKFALAQSLRLRGETVASYPSRKLVPTKQTSVKAD
jgi:HEAT repeat protein